VIEFSRTLAVNTLSEHIPIAFYVDMDFCMRSWFKKGSHPFFQLSDNGARKD
jgi:hypothetical protein